MKSCKNKITIRFCIADEIRPGKISGTAPNNSAWNLCSGNPQPDRDKINAVSGTVCFGKKKLHRRPPYAGWRWAVRACEHGLMMDPAKTGKEDIL
ncbi:MAG: hypothetical protein HDT27_02395 [Subdoligranulum sp.]|nr:hypothetical protein [Subdoligranulum sp.]